MKIPVGKKVLVSLEAEVVMRDYISEEDEGVWILPKSSPQSKGFHLFIPQECMMSIRLQLPELPKEWKWAEQVEEPGSTKPAGTYEAHWVGSGGEILARVWTDRRKQLRVDMRPIAIIPLDVIKAVMEVAP